jgi:hypothetical protein
MEAAPKIPVGNTLTDLMKFLSTPDRPVGSAEFQEFWKSLADEEKEEFRRAKLSYVAVRSPFYY